MDVNSAAINESAWMPPAYDETMNVYNISGQQQPNSPNNNQYNNMFADIGTVNAADLVLIGPVINNRTLPDAQNGMNAVEVPMEAPPSYEDAIKQTTS